MTERETATGSSEAGDRQYGGHSLTGALRRVMVRQPAAPGTDADWQRFGYLHAIDQAKTIAEHEAFVQILRDFGIDVIDPGPDEPGSLDAIFAYDPSLITERGAVLLRPGKKLRIEEVAFHARSYAEIGVPILGEIRAPGTVEGGDTLWIDDRTLAIGQSYRTNRAGIEQMREILGSIGVRVVAYDLAHYRGPGECLHLMSFISPVAPQKAVVYLPLMPVGLAQDLRARDWEFIHVPDEEYDSMACNVLALSPGRCLMLDKNPITKTILEAAGCEVIVYAGEEISQNRAGGPTCLTRPVLRDA